MGKSLIIWLKNGKRLRFEQVEDFYEHDGSIAFTYFCVPTQVKRTARFIHFNMTGYAIEN